MNTTIGRNSHQVNSRIVLSGMVNDFLPNWHAEERAALGCGAAEYHLRLQASFSS